jgi:hypothetical protein
MTFSQNTEIFDFSIAANLTCQTYKGDNLLTIVCVGVSDWLKNRKEVNSNKMEAKEKRVHSSAVLHSARQTGTSFSYKKIKCVCRKQTSIFLLRAWISTSDWFS